MITKQLKFRTEFPLKTNKNQLQHCQMYNVHVTVETKGITQFENLSPSLIMKQIFWEFLKRHSLN